MKDSRFQAAYELYGVLQRIKQGRDLDHVASPTLDISDLRGVYLAFVGVPVVLGEYSDQTIWGHPSANHVQRVWHDQIHMELEADTDVAGEARVSWRQAMETERVSGAILADLVYADTWGQTLYYAKLQSFPIDQASFVWHYLRTGEIKEF